MKEYIRISTLPVFLLLLVSNVFAQRGYYDAPYKRYEADLGVLSHATITPKSYNQADLQSEATDQICVDMSEPDASVELNFLEPADGMVIRYSVPDGETAVLGIYDGEAKITDISLTSKWSWEYLWSNGDPNNVGIKNKNPRMRFDEVRYKLPEKLSGLKLMRESGNLTIDFVEMEPVPEEINAPDGSVTYHGDGSDLQAFIDANGSKTIYIPSGVYNIGSQLYFGVSKTKLQGAGMWYTQLNFTVTNASNGGLRANASQISYADLYITTDMATRTKGYAGIHGVYTPGSVIQNIWVEHCATGAWIGQYAQGGPAFADGFIISGCRFRNTYADGVNLCKGTRNAIVEHCSIRNNGDDGEAIWCAEGLECVNNTFRYNTVENVWRAAGAAVYGGKDNKFYNIIIKDNLEAGLRANNFFAGVGFNDQGQHLFSDITLIGCGTFNDLWNSQIGAIDLACSNLAGTRVQNIKFVNIDILNAKNDGIYIYKWAGEGFYSLTFENIQINGTGKEYPYNNADNLNWGRGYGVLFAGSTMTGNGTYCKVSVSDRGGNATSDTNASNKGTFSWTPVTGCDFAAVEGIRLSPADTSVAGGKDVQLVPRFIPENASNKIVSYTSSNPEVATVGYDGLVKTLAKGETTITITTMDGGKSSFSHINVSSDPLIYYRIKNRWQNTYLYDAGDRVRYNLSANGDSYLWKFEDADGTKEIKNVATGDFMNIHNMLGYLECSPKISDETGFDWLFEDTGDGFVRIKSISDTTMYVHIENLKNQAQYGTIQPSWWSAMWTLEPFLVTTSIAEFPLAKSLLVYPNPSNGDFNLSATSFRANEKVTITVFSVTGQALYSNFFRTDGNGVLKQTISGRGVLSPGNYYVVTKGSSNIYSAKLVVTR